MKPSKVRIIWFNGLHSLGLRTAMDRQRWKKKKIERKKNRNRKLTWIMDPKRPLAGRRRRNWTSNGRTPKEFLILWMAKYGQFNRVSLIFPYSPHDLVCLKASSLDEIPTQKRCKDTCMLLYSIWEFCCYGCQMNFKSFLRRFIMAFFFFPPQRLSDVVDDDSELQM